MFKIQNGLGYCPPKADPPRAEDFEHWDLFRISDLDIRICGELHSPRYASTTSLLESTSSGFPSARSFPESSTKT